LSPRSRGRLEKAEVLERRGDRSSPLLELRSDGSSWRLEGEPGSRWSSVEGRWRAAGAARWRRRHVEPPLSPWSRGGEGGGAGARGNGGSQRRGAAPG